MKAFIVAVVIASLAYCAVAEDRTITVLADKEPVLELTAPANAQVTLIKDKTVIETTNMFLYVWSVAGAKTLDEAQARLDDTIKVDVLKFSASVTNHITLADSPARHLIGSGLEADDQDNATADVVIFKAGNRLFIACVHGEVNEASKEREPMLKVLRTARPPPGKHIGK